MDHTLHNRMPKYSGIDVSDAKRFQTPEDENRRHSLHNELSGTRIVFFTYPAYPECKSY